MIRLILIVAGLVYAILTYGYVTRADWAIALWPWEDGRLSYLFVGSVLSAFAVGALWAGASGRVGAARGSLAGLVLIYGSTGIYLAAISPTAGTTVHAAVALSTAFAAAALWWVLRRAPEEARNLPAYVTASCWIFSLALAGAGTALVLRVGTVFPWPLSDQSATIFGLTFLGLATIYADAAARRRIGAGIVVMAGFLAYDLILLPPFLLLFETIAPERLTSLTVYVVVLIYSAVVALVFLTARFKGRAQSGW